MKKPMLKYVFLLLAVFVFTQCKKAELKYVHNEGEIFGGYYHMTYDCPGGKDFSAEIEKTLHEFNSSLSTYDPNSIISRINNNDSTVKTDVYFEDMYAVAREVSEKSNGAFDITVAPLVKIWGFEDGKTDHSKTPNVDSILPFVGYQKIKLENHRLIKKDPRTKLDAGALAPGQASDVIAKLLEGKGSKNYLIEIGGEIICKGLNSKGQKWHVGIDKPIDDPESNKEEQLQTIIAVSNIGLATSGNYRAFYYSKGKKLSHEINPITGVPEQNNILSVSVTAPTCVQADAYATACMILGKDGALKLCESIPGLECYLIYAEKDGKNKIAYTKGFSQYFIK